MKMEVYQKDGKWFKKDSNTEIYLSPYALRNITIYEDGDKMIMETHDMEFTDVIEENR